MQAKNWYWEATLEAGKLKTAELGFIGVRKKVGTGTRIYLEATALLAICYIRQRELEKAKPHIAETLQRVRSIQSLQQRDRFRRRVVHRFEEESVIVGLHGMGSDILDVNEIDAKVGPVVERTDEREIFRSLGNVVPAETLDILQEVRNYSRALLTQDERRALPSPQTLARAIDHGETVFSALRRAVWRGLCDRESEIYQDWLQRGLKALLGDKKLTAAVTAALAGMKIGYMWIAVYVTALVLRLGIEVYCDRYEPKPIMYSRTG